MLIVVRLNGEIEAKIDRIALLKGKKKEDIIKALRDKAAEIVKEEVEKEYRELVELTV
ncbi:MAG: hypothetical protein ACTSPB_03025 [Candidatus Thorarchaeota archaeon]